MKNLGQRGIKETRERYRVLYDEFCNWVTVRDLGRLLEIAELSTNRPICLTTQAYIQWLYDEDRPISDGRYAVAAVQHFQSHLRGRFKLPWDSIREWQLLEPGLPRTPILPSVVHAAAVLCAV